jgi:hypothetical protein
MDERSSGGSEAKGATVFVEDLFLTDAFLIKGRVTKAGKRLTNVLEAYARTYLQIHDATMVSLRNGEQITTPSVMVNVREVILAHELVEMGGDEHLKRLALPNKTVHIRAFYNGAVQFELGGAVEPGAYESQHGGGRKYFIMQKPVLRGLNQEVRELALLRGLEYAIVRKDRVAYVYDFS